MIYIAYNRDCQPVSIVNARSRDVAIAYWHGAKIIPDTIKSLDDFISIDVHPTGVIPLLTTHLVQVRSLNSAGQVLTIN